MIRRPPRSTLDRSSAASDVYKRQMILCFTDGLIDLKNNKDEFFGDEAIEKFLDENSDLHPEKFNEKLLKEINDFRGELEINDDIAVLTCKIF